MHDKTAPHGEWADSAACQAQRGRAELYKSMTCLAVTPSDLWVDFTHEAGERDGLTDVVNAA